MNETEKKPTGSPSFWHTFIHSKKGVTLLGLLLLTIIAGSLWYVTNNSLQSKYVQATNPKYPKYLYTEKRADDSHIFVLKNAENQNETIKALAEKYGFEVDKTFSSAMNGFSAKMSDETAQRISQDKEIKYAQQNGKFEVNVGSWGLDRIDQRPNPVLDGSYTAPNSASNVNVYIIDTGLHTDLAEFGGRATADFASATDTTKGVGNDCHGHGTHVAGTIGSQSFGVAPGVRLHGVRVMNCGGSGSTAEIVAGLDWVTQNAVKPAVANMSIGGPIDQIMNDAVDRSIASGITYAVAAGNSSTNACSQSPSSTPNAITVGATDINDKIASFSNLGPCLDIFAPGVNITSVIDLCPSLHSPDLTPVCSGTSMATPHVAGVAAVYLSTHPSASPSEVTSAIIGNGTKKSLQECIVDSLGSPTNSPSLIVNVNFNGPPSPEIVPLPEVARGTPPTLTVTPDSIRQYRDVFDLNWSLSGPSHYCDTIEIVQMQDDGVTPGVSWNFIRTFGQQSGVWKNRWNGPAGKYMFRYSKWEDLKRGAGVYWANSKVFDINPSTNPYQPCSYIDPSKCLLKTDPVPTPEPTAARPTPTPFCHPYDPTCKPGASPTPGSAPTGTQPTPTPGNSPQPTPTQSGGMQPTPTSGVQPTPTSTQPPTAGNFVDIQCSNTPFGTYQNTDCTIPYGGQGGIKWDSNMRGCVLTFPGTRYNTSPSYPANASNVQTSDYRYDIICYNQSDHLDANPPRDSITIKVAPQTSSFNTTCNGATYYGGLSDSKMESILPNTNGFYAGNGGLYASIKINGNSNVRMVLEKKQLGFIWNDIAKSSGQGEVQTLTAQLSEGTYRWRVESTGGNSSFALCAQIP